MFRVKIALALAAALLVAGLAWAHPPQYHRARLVRFPHPLPAPAITVQDVNGAPVRLADYRGRYVLLNFWATWCPPCVKEMPSLARLARQMGDAPFMVLAVSVDMEGAAKVRPFIARVGVTFPIALDPDSKAADAYGAYDLPTTFLIDPQGRVIVAAKGGREWDSPEIVSYLRELMGERT